MSFSLCINKLFLYSPFLKLFGHAQAVSNEKADLMMEKEAIAVLQWTLLYEL